MVLQGLGQGDARPHLQMPQGDAKGNVMQNAHPRKVPQWIQPMTNTT